MRVVVDTNVVLSGTFFGGTPGRILVAWSQQRFAWLLSEDILAEYIRAGEALARSHPSVSFSPLIERIAAHAHMIASPPLPQPVSADPDDDKFLACAVAGRADFIVSGDRHLIEVGSYRGIAIVSPRRFAETLEL